MLRLAVAIFVIIVLFWAVAYRGGWARWPSLFSGRPNSPATKDDSALATPPTRSVGGASSANLQIPGDPRLVIPPMDNPGGVNGNRPPRAILDQRLDKVPPVSSATVTHLRGDQGAPMTVVTISADDVGGSGVGEVLYFTSGAQSGQGLSKGTGVAVVITAKGRTVLIFFAQDRAGNEEAPKRIEVNN